MVNLLGHVPEAGESRLDVNEGMNNMEMGEITFGGGAGV